MREGPREGRQMLEKGPISELWLGLWEEVTRVRGRRWGRWVQGPERRRADRLEGFPEMCVDRELGKVPERCALHRGIRRLLSR